MIHTKTLKEAVLTAVPGALIWKKDETCLDAQELLKLAQEQDGQELAPGSFYVVSREGAIGLADRFEYRTSWLWIPLQGEELVSALTELGAQRKAQHDAADAVVPMPEEEKAAALAAAEPIPEEPIPEQPIPVLPVPEEPAPQLLVPEEPAPQPPVPEQLPQQVFSVPQGRPAEAPSYVPEPPAPQPPAAKPAASEPICPSCGHVIRAGDRFCIFCGASLAPKPAPEPKKTFCINCGSPLKPGDRFCMNCGTRV